MIMHMRTTVLAILLGIFALAALPSTARAQDETTPSPPKVYDGRLEMLSTKRPVTLDTSGTAGVWFTLLGLGAVCMGVMFKNAGRTHLD